MNPTTHIGRACTRGRSRSVVPPPITTVYSSQLNLHDTPVRMRHSAVLVEGGHTAITLLLEFRSINLQIRNRNFAYCTPLERRAVTRDNQARDPVAPQLLVLQLLIYSIYKIAEAASICL